MRYTSSHWGSYSINTDGTLKPLADDPAPTRIGKGWVSAARDTHSRIARPAVRQGWLDGDQGAKRCSDSFVEVSWDKVTDLVSASLRQVISEHGNEAIYAGSYGWASTGRFHHAQSHLRRFLNLCGGFTSSRDTYSHAAAEVIWPWVIGMSNDQFQNQMTSWPLVEEQCQILLAFGGISGRTGQVSSSGTRMHEVPLWLERIGQSGCRVINVSPQRSDMREIPGAEWLAIRPGTDRALMLGLCHCVLESGRADMDFLTRCTSGWPAFRDYLLGTSDGQAKTADWAAALCDIPADHIRQLADDLTRHRSMITCTWAMQRADGGELTIWAGLALACMLGQIGQPGTGYGFGYGSTTTVGRPEKLYPWPSLPQGKNPVDRFIPVARVADMLLHPGQTYSYNGQDLRYPDIALVWWSGGNPFHHHQDLHRLERAWTKPETVIIQDHTWTATARRADIVLPATVPLEREDMMMNRKDGSLIYMSALDEDYGEALDDYEILTLIAQKMGVAEAYTQGRDTEGWLRWLWDKARRVGNERGFVLPEFDEFRAQGRIDLPDRAETRIAFQAFVADPEGHPLGTESGKITLHNQSIAALGLPDCPGLPAWTDPAESLLKAPRGALHLISGQPDTRLHSQNDRGSEAQADKIQGREPCYLHPDAAKARGLNEGDVVKVLNSRGACLAGLRITDAIRSDCISLPTGAWFDPAEIDGEIIDVHGNPNVLTLDKGATAFSQANIAQSAIVWVERWTKPVPEKTVDKLPVIKPIA